MTGRTARGWALVAAWPLLLAAGPPVPPGGFAAGINGLPRALETTLDAARAAGFDTVRVFMRWDRIETVEGAPDWTCKYVTEVDLGPDADGDGTPDVWPGIPCDGTPCGCGYSADERAAMAGHGVPILLTILGTPAWARGQPMASCPGDTPGRAMPLRRGKEATFAAFAAAVVLRYGTVAYGFELWNEPDLAACVYWAGTPEQYKDQILSAATAVKAAGISPGLVVAPTLENPSGAAMDLWMDWSQPIDLLSFNLYQVSLGRALGKIDEMNAWCGATRRCPGFYVTEFGARRAGVSHCPGPRTTRPGAADVAIMKRCRQRRWCRGFFLYALSDQQERQPCDRGLFTARGCPKPRLCAIAHGFFAIGTLPFTCGRCGPAA